MGRCRGRWSHGHGTFQVPAQLQPNHRWKGAAYHWSHGQGIRGDRKAIVRQRWLRRDQHLEQVEAIVKANAITAASEATCLLLSVDETVKNPRSGQGADQMGGGMPGGMGRGRGRPM